MKLPRRRFLHLAAGAAAFPTISHFAWAQTTRHDRSTSLSVFLLVERLTSSLA
jgi:hypothetical protein